MKFVPDAIARKVARQALLVSKNSPSLLFGAGIIGMVGSTVLACRATLKLEEVTEHIGNDLYIARNMDSTEYSEDDRKKDVTLIYFRGVGTMVKLYAPSVLIGAASIGCLTKSHIILQDRNVALTAAYVAVDEAFKQYRERVIERYGEEVDRDIRFESKVVEEINEDTGEITSSLQVDPDGKSQYARWYDVESSSSWSRDPDINFHFLRTQQTWANDLLRARGHMFLNEVYGMIGLSHTSAGAVVGWVFDPVRESGDNYIDFGFWDYVENGPQEFFNGREGAVLLDFNVDGLIWDKIDKLKRGM